MIASTPPAPYYAVIFTSLRTITAMPQPRTRLRTAEISGTSWRFM